MKKETSSKKSPLEVVKSLYWLWLTLIVLFLICVIVFILLYKYFQKKYEESEKSCGEQFNINDDLKLSKSSEGKFCFSAKQYQQGQICFQLEQDNVIIQFGNKTKDFGPISNLPMDENASSNYTIAGQNLLIFQYPFASNTVSIRNLSQPLVPGRLCFNFDKKVAFVSAPTENYIFAGT